MKKIVFILLITFVILPLHAVSLSGTVDTDVAVAGAVDDISLENVDRLTLRGFFPFGKDDSMSITAEAYYEFELTKPLTSGDAIAMSHLVDLSTLKFSGLFPINQTSSLGLTVGRFFVKDATSLILSQPLDGIKLDVNGSIFTLSSHVGFTGFLNGHAVTMYGVENTNILSDFYTLAPAFVLADFTFRLPYLFDGQHAFTLDFNTAIDVQGNAKKRNRFYVGFGLQGPMGVNFFYNVSSTLGYVMQDQNMLSNLSILELSAFLPANTIVSWKTVFATGGAKLGFMPITDEQASCDSSIPFAGNIKTGLIATMSPVDSLLLLAGTDVFINIMDPVRDIGYAGVQWNFSLRWNIVSDVQLITSVENFFSSVQNTKPYINASLKLAINF